MKIAHYPVQRSTQPKSPKNTLQHNYKPKSSADGFDRFRDKLIVVKNRSSQQGYRNNKVIT